jgi:hypothetical protein
VVNIRHLFVSSEDLLMMLVQGFLTKFWRVLRLYSRREAAAAAAATAMPDEPEHAMSHVKHACRDSTLPPRFRTQSILCIQLFHLVLYSSRF